MGKRHQDNLKKVESEKSFSLTEALDLLQKMKAPKFDETVEVSIKLGVDTRKADQLLRGSFSFPKGIGGKSKRIIVFVDGEAAKAAKEAGADEADGDDLVKMPMLHNKNTPPATISPHVISYPPMVKTTSRLTSMTYISLQPKNAVANRILAAIHLAISPCPLR